MPNGNQPTKLQKPGRRLTREELQAQATEFHLRNEGSKMIINPDILKKAQRTAREETDKIGSGSSEQKK